MGMSGYDRVLVEPSGIYDTDEFFDALHEEPLDRWYETGSVIAVVDAKLEPDLSEAADYILASEAACAGCILISRTPGSPGRGDCGDDRASEPGPGKGTVRQKAPGRRGDSLQELG